MEKRALAIAAHPDDAEFLCAGTLALLHKRGWEIYIATMTAGDCGSKVLDRDEISRIRKVEAANSANILNGGYECLGAEDIFIPYDKPTLLRVIAHVRKIQPQLVFTMSPSCYMLDHEITSRLAQTACFAGGIVNIETPGIPPMDYIPHLYYADPLEGKDKYGTEIIPTILVDITTVVEIKTEMLSCHKSQREWLRQHHGMDEYIHSMKRLSEERGQRMGVKFAEGFRQHLGHAFPQNNLIREELNQLVK
jgi:LmbE family N-acetylglucosaminyl deacetylase